MVRLIRASLRSSAAFGAILLTTVLAVSSVQGAECTSSDASVQSAYKLEGPATASAAVHASPPLRGVALGDWIGVEIEALPKLLDEAKCRNKSIIPVLNGRSFTEMTIFGPSTKDSNVIFFRLLRTSAQRSLWAELLGSPGFEPRKVSVTLRMEGEIPLPANSSSTVLDLEVVNGWSLAGALTCFFALLAAFLLLANRTNIMRDAAPPDYAVPIVNGELSPTKPTANRGPYSLSRLQGAWWFFIILGMYLLIGVVTWDFSASISSTAVILLGIGAGTVVGAAVIDISQDTPEQQATREQRATELAVQIERLSKTIDAFTFASLEAKRLGFGLDQHQKAMTAARARAEA
ncbi:hypothetical protein [Methylobacterium sp. 13MFTsu3.1M2]|uniref:hypothetical protein n=1 Tax=Methylobacterium sp. 13MFTsu3.1M2 TaxID=1502776 RepID=UPI0008E3C9E1|nr:hypothetical protein [Methylobacterium sp. 13MFTsu3.1M2]SFF23794.1 hypothetical protein SAMN02799627_05789 [Methylobacterium sp. 13MFTsu3.1M2]